MKKHIADKPIETVLSIAKNATRKAALNATSAGRTVTGLENGKVVQYGPGALPLEPTQSEQGKVNADTV